MVDVQNVEAIFALLGRMRAAFRYLRERLSPSAVEATIGNVADSFYAGTLDHGSKYKLTGVLSPYVLSTNQLAYRPIVSGRTREEIKGQGFDPVAGRPFVRVNVTSSSICLPVPAVQLPTVAMSEGEPARIVWLYPRTFDSFVLPRTDHDGPVYAPLEAFAVAEQHRPIPCLVPPSAVVKGIFGREVEIQGYPVAAPPSVTASLMERLDPFSLNLFSHCIRPFDAESRIFAIDLRSSDSEIRTIGDTRDFPMVISVQGTISVDADIEGWVAAVVDAIPDRSGMGPLRGMQFRGGGPWSILSDGDLRWVIDSDRGAIGIYASVDQGSFSAGAAAMVGHWQAWQRRARKAVRDATGREIKIAPLQAWDQEKLPLFHPDGFVLDPELEARVCSTDASVREGIDWLRVASGRSA